VHPGDGGERLRLRAAVADLAEEGQRILVAQGGRGGRGNARFVTSIDRAPRRADLGRPGRERWLHLELKLLADVGLVGFPNAGKSTLISRISAAKPKIADYPFTTLVPNLGVVGYDEGKSFVLADIPGLIEGAHEGHGLGDKFLRHVTRTSLLIHLLDAVKIDPENPLRDWLTINRELELFDPELAAKPQVVVANKIDIAEAREKAELLEAKLPERYRPLYLISAVTGEGVRPLMQKVGMHLEKAKRVTEEVDDAARL
jgi:GTP-binding protein